MDALSLLTASVPSYFVIGPLVIVLAVLIVLIGKKDTPKVVAQVVVQASPAQVTPAPSVPPAVEAAPVFMQAHVQAPVIETPVVTTQQVPINMSTVSQATSPVPMHEPTMPQQPELAVTQAPIPIPSTPPVMPPISSWKPAAPAPLASGDLIGKNEGTLQAQAIAQEVTPVVEAVKVQAVVMDEPVVVTETVTHQETAVTEDIHAVASATPVPVSVSAPEPIVPPVIPVPVPVSEVKV